MTTFTALIAVNPTDDYAHFGLGLAASKAGELRARRRAPRAGRARCARTSRHYARALRGVRARQAAESGMTAPTVAVLAAGSSARRPCAALRRRPARPRRRRLRRPGRRARRARGPGRGPRGRDATGLRHQQRRPHPRGRRRAPDRARRAAPSRDDVITSSQAAATVVAELFGPGRAGAAGRRAGRRRGPPRRGPHRRRAAPRTSRSPSSRATAARSAGPSSPRPSSPSATVRGTSPPTPTRRSRRRAARCPATARWSASSARSPGSRRWSPASPIRPCTPNASAGPGARRPLVVGDRLDTDIEGARRAGAASLLVLTGVTDPGALLAAGPDQRPGPALRTTLPDCSCRTPGGHAPTGTAWRCGTLDGASGRGRRRPRRSRRTARRRRRGRARRAAGAVRGALVPASGRRRGGPRSWRAETTPAAALERWGLAPDGTAA